MRLLPWLVVAAAQRSRDALSLGTSISIPRNSAPPLQLQLPPASSAGGIAVRDAAHLFRLVSHTWEAVVQPNQAGLVDAKASAAASAPLTPSEAMHHYRACKAAWALRHSPEPS